MRALVVDDSRPVRSILGKMLRELHFEVSEASNGREGLALLKELESVDLATVNWNMPVMDGLAFVQAVRSQARFRKLPLVMVTSEGEPSMRAKALKAGANDYIVKPFTKKVLAKALNDLGLVLSEATEPRIRESKPVRTLTRKIRVLIVDDSVIIRRTLAKVFDEDTDLEVAGTAADGRIALNSLETLNPDVIILDVEMPNMDGFETLKALRKTHPLLPVIMFSALTERGAAATLDALMLGANDYMPKPAAVNDFEVAKQSIREELIPKIKQFAHVGTKPKTSVAYAAPRQAPSPTKRRQVQLVVIGVSTGGPVALAQLLPRLTANSRVPVMIVQHMPPMFTKHLADRLASLSSVPVHEAQDKQQLQPGEFYIAPGGFHMEVVRSGALLQVNLNQDPPLHSCRPAADVLFRSAAAVTGAGTLAVVLTGMGRDALEGCRAIADAGGQVVVQNEATSVVWGMPGHVARAGLAQATLPLNQIADEILRRVNWKGKE